MLVGVSLGLLGGGGSILTVPILLHVFRLEAKVAIASSLVVVGVTSAVAAMAHARQGRVRPRVALTFGASTMIGAYAAGSLTRYARGEQLVLGFAVVLLVTGGLMLRPRKAGASPSASALGARSMARLLTLGFFVGILTGSVGAGGGFLSDPAVVLIGRLAMREAVATSLMVIAMNCVAGLAGYLGHVTVEWRIAALATAAAVLGSVIGLALGGKFAEARLRQAFGGLAIAIGVYLLVA